MNFYNIHTHHISCITDNICEILNVDIKKFRNEKLLDTNGFFSCGIHPWDTQSITTDDFNRLEELVQDNRVVAIGEIGYDKNKGADIGIQEAIFEKQVLLSEQIEKPLIIHCVKAWDELLKTKKKLNPKQPWIIHGYRGKPQITEQLLKFGFCFSLGLYFNETSLKIIPKDKLFLETDILHISVMQVYEKVSKILGISIESLSNQISKNVIQTLPLIKKYI